MTLRGRPQLLDPASRPTQTAGTSVTAAAPPPLHAEALRALVDEPCHASTATPPASGPPSRPSFVGGIPSAGLAALAVPLRRADSAYEDEVRYVDVSAEASVSVDVCDLEVMEIGSIADLQADALLTEALEAERLVHLSATKLFVDVPHAALVELARVSELLALRTGQSVVRKGEPADALFVIVEGTAHVLLSWVRSGGIDLREGQVFGETCPLREATRQADVLAKREMLLLRIPRDTLHEMVAGQADVHRQLFDLLVTRLLTNTLQTSPLFAAFDSAQRRELATLFEVRRAAPGIVLEQQGKRSDGLYLTLAGEFRVVQGRPPGPLPPGALLGHTSILGQTPANRTVIAVVESIVLRMPAARFGDFAARFPPVLAYLADLAPRSEAL